MMIGKFIYSLTEEDYVKFEELKLKQNKAWLMSAISTLLICAIFTFYAVERGTYIYLIIPVVTIIDSIFTYYYVNNIRPKKNAKKCIDLDKSYLNPKEITFYSDSIELKTLPKKDGDPAIVGVYPFSVMSAIIESNDYFQFITVSEANVLPKRVIPQEILQAVENTIRKNPNYTLLKNV
ncbi:MAG: hypothetical protein ACI4V4_01330 [Eubacterium sp.]